MLSHETAAEVAGLTDRPSAKIHLTVPTCRTPAWIPGVILHRSARAEASRHPTRTPPQTRVEETVIDLTQSAKRVDDALAWLARAVGSRLTTGARLSTALARRGRLRWRTTLRAAVDDVREGCHSLIELLYLRDVERAHGLPRGSRQRPTIREGHIRYDDVVYEDYATVVELDGRMAHPEPERFRDMRRDNAVVDDGGRPLRYGHGDVLQAPCEVAAQVVRALRRGGWTGRPRRCRRPRCPFA
jgi:hypothetical protein